MSQSRPFTFDRVIRILIGLAFVTGVYWLVNRLSNVLLPFFLACLISYILEPLVEFNLKKLHLHWRIAAIFFTLTEVTLVIGGLIYFFLPSVLKEIHDMAAIIRDYSAHNRSLPFIPKEIHDYLTAYFDDDTMVRLLEGQHLESILSKGTSVISASVGFVIHTLEWFLAFIYVIFILLDYQHIMRGFGLLVPPKYRPIASRIGNDIKNSMNRYFRGQALLPYFQYITIIPVAFVCMIVSMNGEAGFWTEFGKCLLVYAISQCSCDYILTPKIMGKAMGLNPAIILLSLSVWGTLLGLIGMIIALPLTTLLLAYYEEYVIRPGCTDRERTTDENVRNRTPMK